MTLEKMAAKKKELREVRDTMRSISPRLSLYSVLDTRRKRLEEELATMGAERLSISPVGESNMGLTA